MDNTERALNACVEPLDCWLLAPDVTDICLNPDGRLWVERNGIFVEVDGAFLDDGYLSSFVSLCARYNRCVANDTMPLLQGVLPSGARIQIIMPPIVDRVSFVIRRHQMMTLTMHDYVQNKSFIDLKSPKPSVPVNRESFTLDRLVTLVTDHRSVIIAGGTGSGKTTFMRALMASIPQYERLLLLEDTPELQVTHDNVLPLMARGNSNFDMQLLLKTALRCRPDRIIMGEIRGREMFDFVSSLSSGHGGGMATIHAGSVNDAWQRMVHLYKQNNVPAMTDIEILNEIKQVVDCIVVLERTREGRQLVDVYEK